MSSQPGAVIQKLASNMTQTVAEQANDFVQGSTTKAAFDKALTLGEQIANYTCKELNNNIPTMITTTTNEIIKQLTAKIDSEEFTTDFINVLQTKLLRDETYSEKFLSKFDDLFDRVIKEAKDRHDKKEYAKAKEEQSDNTNNMLVGNGRHKRSKRRRSNEKKPTKLTKRVRFSMKK
jgi:hypothetical protein